MLLALSVHILCTGKFIEQTQSVKPESSLLLVTPYCLYYAAFSQAEFELYTGNAAGSAQHR